jgi:ABC-type bacteriocin/lantibiotic exporter with double-glycine peptidase domain
VLFLDEGTANLDEETERKVVDTIAACRSPASSSPTARS